MTLNEALSRLDLTHVWDMAPNPGQVPAPKRGNVVVKSPFRLDHKGKSFSVDGDLKLFKDHADGSKGGVWKFIELCEPNWSKREIARELIRRAGGDPDSKDPSYQPKSRADRFREAREAGDRAHHDFIKQQTRLETIPPEKIGEIFGELKKRWNHYLLSDNTKSFAAALAEERGWPVDWVIWLVDLCKLGFDKKGNPVFAVEAERPDGLLYDIGWHSRWIADNGDKRWAYRPNLKWDKREIVAAPFVLGSTYAPLWILTEGQWDAVTAFGMLGGFEDVMYVESAVFGIRGVSGRGVFMSLYKDAIRRYNPCILLIPDADDAAVCWTENIGKQWSFMRQLKAIFPRLDGKLAALKLKRRGNLKDVNDFYKHAGLRSERFVDMVTNAIEKLSL